jgi:hypothetical protein
MSMKHLQERRDDWETATDQEWAEALLSPPALICPFFMAFARNRRPEALRRSLLLHRDLGGYLGPPARRFLLGKR